MFCETKTIAEPKAQSRPNAFEADTSNEHASITPIVSGSKDTYVFGEYFTPNMRAYAATVNRGDSA